MDIFPVDARKIRIESNDYGALYFRSLIEIPDQAAGPKGMIGRNIFIGKSWRTLAGWAYWKQRPGSKENSPKSNPVGAWVC